jgi:hypothetical protein
LFLCPKIVIEFDIWREIHLAQRLLRHTLGPQINFFKTFQERLQRNLKVSSSTRVQKTGNGWGDNI